MKGLLGLVGLLVALLIVGLLVKKQLAATQLAVPAPTTAQPGAAGPEAASVPSLHGSGRQIEQQYKQALDAAMQKARPASDQN